jgi:hypothetical protein
MVHIAPGQMVSARNIIEFVPLVPVVRVGQKMTYQNHESQINQYCVIAPERVA